MSAASRTKADLARAILARKGELTPDVTDRWFRQLMRASKAELLAETGAAAAPLAPTAYEEETAAVERLWATRAAAGLGPVPTDQVAIGRLVALVKADRKKTEMAARSLAARGLETERWMS